MDGFAEFLQVVKRAKLAQGNFLGFLNVVIGRRIQAAQGEIVSTGVPWRVLAQELKKVRWDKEVVRELGLDPRSLPPRDRERYWYAVIARGQVGSPEASAAGDRFAEVLAQVGYLVGSPPRT